MGWPGLPGSKTGLSHQPSPEMVGLQHCGIQTKGEMVYVAQAGLSQVLACPGQTSFPWPSWKFTRGLLVFTAFNYIIQGVLCHLCHCTSETSQQNRSRALPWQSGTQNTLAMRSRAERKQHAKVAAAMAATSSAAKENTAESIRVCR